MFSKFIHDVVDNDVLKTHLSEQYMLEVSQKEGVWFVKSPVMYRLYTLYTGDGDKINSRSAFYRKCGTYLYYERLTCAHGDEYYYYVKFNTESDFYKEHHKFIKELILAEDPTTLDDYIGLKDLNAYNKELKENQDAITKRTR